MPERLLQCAATPAACLAQTNVEKALLRLGRKATPAWLDGSNLVQLVDLVGLVDLVRLVGLVGLVGLVLA
jgi:hypothetical protein